MQPENLTITVYGRDGKLRPVILGPRGLAARNIRRALTAIEFELENELPNEEKIGEWCMNISDELTKIWKA